ncbi:MAG: formyltransferase family protein [Candidatus Sulfotelmatobacter sp.]
MRVVILASSLYSETACAMALRLADLGFVPRGALALRTLDPQTLARKLGQWGVRDFARYARAKLIPRRDGEPSRIHNPYLEPYLKHDGRIVRSLRDVAKYHRFPAAVCKDQNAPASTTRLREWSPDVIIFTGGNILRKEVLAVPRLGVLNVHLGLLPEVRGMSSPEWSLLNRIPPGVTIHYMDAGIDTGPILRRAEFHDAERCESLGELRARLIAFGIEKTAEVVAALDQGTLLAKSQSDQIQHRQFFVMHEWLQARAAQQLAAIHFAASAGRAAR